MNEVLLGPADPDYFRVRVGYERWYTDPLPGCDIAEASDANYPSISRVKKAASSDWSFVTMRRIANASDNDLRTLAELDPTRRLGALKLINNHGLSIDAGRGTIVHWWGEDLLNGRPMREITMLMLADHGIPAEALEIAELYKDALRDFFDAYKPRLYATEYVVIHRSLNGVGYGGTPDGLWWLDDPPAPYKPGLYAFDYKTRSPVSRHGAYPEEAAQVAAGAFADYMIVRGPHGEAVRQRIPELQGGMIVSIRPDGARVYPIDLEAAWADWQERHRWYLSRQKEKEGIGRVWPTRRAPKEIGRAHV